MYREYQTSYYCDCADITHIILIYQETILFQNPLIVICHFIFFKTINFQLIVLMLETNKIIIIRVSDTRRQSSIDDRYH